VPQGIRLSTSAAMPPMLSSTATAEPPCIPQPPHALLLWRWCQRTTSKRREQPTCKLYSAASGCQEAGTDPVSWLPGTALQGGAVNGRRRREQLATCSPPASAGVEACAAP
jgi:hypothetical protein